MTGDAHRLTEVLRALPGEQRLQLVDDLVGVHDVARNTASVLERPSRSA